MVGEDESDETGVFDIRCPATRSTNLGKSFTVKIDEETLPEDTALRNPDQVELTIRFTSTPTSRVTFPIGEPVPAAPARRSRRCSSPSAAWCSPRCSRWPPWACR